jgi:hypothetical protein
MPACHAGDTGSIPVRTANQQHKIKMNLSKYIGKINTKIHDLQDYEDFPVFSDGVNHYWFEVQYTDNDEFVIRDTCGRVMPLPVEVLTELGDLMFDVEQVYNAQKVAQNSFDTPSTSEF